MRHKKNKTVEIIRTFWKRILHLPFGRRLSFFSGIFAIIFLFSPWFSEGNATYNAFGKTLVFGWILFLISLFIILIILREIFSHISSIGNFSHGNILIFLFSQALYTTVLANSALSMLLFEKSDYSINIGIMLTFISFGIGLAGSVFSKNFIPKSEEKKQIFIDKNIDLSHTKIKGEKDLSLKNYDKN